MTGGGTIVNRDQFLSRVSSAVMASDAPPPPIVAERLPDLDPVDHLAMFRLRAQTVDAVVHGPVTRHGVPRAIIGIAAGHECETFASWDDLPVSGIPTALTVAGLTRVGHVVPSDGRKAHQMEYASLDLGVTGSVAGLAESGSVVLTHGPGKARMVSLSPEVHVVLLEVANIDRTLAFWAARHPEMTRQTANLVIVTGPSRTGDIELELNLGVHGPRHVHVILIR